MAQFPEVRLASNSLYHRPGDGIDRSTINGDHPIRSRLTGPFHVQLTALVRGNVSGDRVVRPRTIEPLGPIDSNADMARFVAIGHPPRVQRPFSIGLYVSVRHGTARVSGPQLGQPDRYRHISRSLIWFRLLHGRRTKAFVVAGPIGCMDSVRTAESANRTRHICARSGGLVLWKRI